MKGFRRNSLRKVRVVIFFSLTEAPLPNPIQHPEMEPNPKQTRNGAETEPNGPETEPKWTEINLWRGTARGGVVGVGGGEGCKGKRTLG